MKALLLAAGLGTRLRPLTERIPKCLVPINGKPLLAYWLDLLLANGVDEVLINTHYMAEQVVAFVKSSPWQAQISLVHEPLLLGTGGTVLANRSFFGRATFMVVHADNLSRFSVQAFLEAHHNRPKVAEMTMMTFDTDAPSTCGIVETDTQGIVVAFHEKLREPPGTQANGAVYIFEPTVVDFISSLGKSVIDLSTEVIPHFIGRIATYHNSDYHRDIGVPESLRRAEADAARISR